MKRTLRLGSIATHLVVAIAGIFGGYVLYERHYLSSGLKRTLTAAMDASALENDVMTYLRDARLQVNTTRDAEVLEQLETCIQLAKDSREISDRHLNRAMQSLSNTTDELRTFNSLVDLRSKYWGAHMPVPKNLQALIDEEAQNIKTRRKQDEELYAIEEKRASDESNTANRLYKEVRAELGLTPLPATAPKAK